VPDPASPRHARPSRRSRRPSLGALAFLSGLLLLVTSPPVARINGVRVPVGWGWRVGQAAAVLGLRVGAGDLVAVGGGTLVKGGGVPASAWVGNRRLDWDERLPRRQRIVMRPGADVTEPLRDTVRFVDSPFTLLDKGMVGSGTSRPYARGLERTQTGARSGQPAGWEVAYASAVVRTLPADSPARRVALTFDDGPNPPTTGRILDLLKRYHARGTFFVLGQGMRPLASTLRRTASEGHEIGLHSWHHDLFLRKSDAWIRADLTRCQKTLASLGLPPARWFRPTYGAHSARTDRVARSLGLHIALWDIDPFDWRRPGAGVIYNRIISRVHSGDIILMHDGGGPRSQTVAALEQLLKTLSARGYEFVTLSDLEGIESPFTGVVRLQVGGEWFTYRPRLGRGPLTVSGVTLKVEDRALECRGEALVPARAASEQLGCALVYDKPAQVLTLRGRGGELVLRMDSPQAQIDGRRELLPVPPVLYRQVAYVPLSALRRVAVPAGGRPDPVGWLNPGRAPAPRHAPAPWLEVALPGLEPDTAAG
jgi:peptidoglycan-N-acetylglucosamine deacetylase